MEELNEKLHIDLLDFDQTRRKEWISQRKPFSVLFELTSRCNMNCIHCYLKNNHISEELSYDEIIEIIDILYEKSILFLTFTGGEVLTRKDFIDIYLYAKKKGFLVEVFTNGYLINKQLIEIFKKYPPLLVDISLYGADEKTYYQITGIKGAFSRVIENCRQLKEAKIRTFFKSPIIKPTLSQIHNMQKIADDIGVPFIYSFEICSAINGDCSPKTLQVSLSQILKNEFLNYYEQIKNGQRQKKQEISQIEKDVIANDHVYTCNVALNSFVIDYKGRMLPCMKLRHHGIKLTKDNYDLIWDNFKQYCELKCSPNYPCYGCDSRYYCDICPGEMEFLYHDSEYRNERLCLCAKIRKQFYNGEISFEEALKLAEKYD